MHIYPTSKPYAQLIKYLLIPIFSQIQVNSRLKRQGTAAESSFEFELESSSTDMHVPLLSLVPFPYPGLRKERINKV
jgi:hypothetical protein